MDQHASQARSDWLRFLCTGQMRRMQMLQEGTHVVDLMALMRVVTAIPETFEDLAIKLTSILSNQRLSMS